MEARLVAVRRAGLVLALWLGVAGIVATRGDATKIHWATLWAYSWGYVAVWFWPTLLLAHWLAPSASIWRKAGPAALVALVIGYLSFP